MAESSIKVSDKENSKAIHSKGNNSSESSKNISKIISGITTQSKNLEIFSNKSNTLYDVNDFLIKLQEIILPKEPIYDLIQNFDEKKLKERLDTILDEINILINNQKKCNPLDFLFNFSETYGNNNINYIDPPIIHINSYENINYNSYNFNVSKSIDNISKNVKKSIFKRNIFKTMNPTLVIRKNNAIKRFKPKNIGKRKRNKLMTENISFNNNDKKNIIKLKERIFNEKVIRKSNSFVEQKKIKKLTFRRKYNY